MPTTDERYDREYRVIRDMIDAIRDTVQDLERSQALTPSGRLAIEQLLNDAERAMLACWS